MLSRSESRKEIKIATDKITVIILNRSNCKHGPYKKKKVKSQLRRLFGGRNTIDLINLS